jgi:hypothetical protein
MGQRRSRCQRGSIDAASICQTRTALGRIRKELHLLRCEQATILERIQVIRQVLISLSETFRSDIAGSEQLREVLSSVPGYRSEFGLTAVCRQVLMSSSQALTTNQICSLVQEMDPTLLARHKHPKVSVFVVVKRQVQYGVVVMGKNDRGRRTWRWAGGGAGEIVAW